MTSRRTHRHVDPLDLLLATLWGVVAACMALAAVVQVLTLLHA